MGFIDQMRSQGFAVESICRVLREQGVQIAARTYRSWRNPVIAKRTITDAMVLDAVRDIVWEVEEHVDGTTRRKMTPEGLYGRKKMTAYIRRTAIADASRGAVDRAMRALGLQGITRAKAIRTTILAKDGIRAGDLLNRDFTAPFPDHTWVTDFTYVRTWAGWVYVAFILDVYSQRIVAWHAQTTRHADLVMIPLRMALWERSRQGHPIRPGQLIHHSDAGSQGGFNRSSQHLVIMEVFDGSSSTGSGSGDPTEAPVARASEVPAACRGSVLGRDRQGVAAHRGRCRGRRGASGRSAMVPPRWRHAAVRSEVQTNRALPVVRRA